MPREISHFWLESVTYSMGRHVRSDNNRIEKHHRKRSSVTTQAESVVLLPGGTSEVVIVIVTLAQSTILGYVDRVSKR